VGGKSHYEINVFLQNTLGTIICPLLLNTFASSFCKENSQRESSPIMPDEFGEHLTRDQRLVLHTESLQIHRSMLALLLFSSAHSFSIGFS